MTKFYNFCLILAVPALDPHITLNVSGVLYAGIALSLSCSHLGLSDFVDTDVQINVTWRVNDSNVVTHQEYIVDEFILILSPLKTSHTERYSCLLTVTTPQDHILILEPEQTAERHIIVQSKHLIIV